MSFIALILGAPETVPAGNTARSALAAVREGSVGGYNDDS